jgi:hypothetical protein
MARWHDIASWRGPSPNISEGKQTEVRGLVVHIAEGWYEGTISWQKNPSADVSSHFIVSRAGKIAQMVDTADAAWTQRSGNGEWMSVECEGFTKGNKRNPGGWESLSDAQIDAIARLLLRCHTSYSVPLQATSSATGRGLGHHSMGGESWGHLDCPGPPIIAQKNTIVSRAQALKSGNANGDNDMQTSDKLPVTDWTEDKWGVKTLTVATALSHGYTFSRAASDNSARIIAEQKAARLRDEAILSAIKGVDTKGILARIDQRAAEDAQRDAADAQRDGEILALIQKVGSGTVAADVVLDEIARLITKPRE